MTVKEFLEYENGNNNSFLSFILPGNFFMVYHIYYISHFSVCYDLNICNISLREGQGQLTYGVVGEGVYAYFCLHFSLILPLAGERAI